ncbi:MAG: hypothetical protein JWO06_67 [Bacteroidota bacterium]|nr:hypothetical protein [Bacteroidota bacterium]
MNLLFDFLKNLNEPEQAQLAELKVRGNVQQVWSLLNEQVLEDKFDRNKILTTTGISSSHFDKITSELLGKCYVTLFGDHRLELLNLLSLRLPFLKHFYSELNRQMKQVETELQPEQRLTYYIACFDLMQANLPIAYRDEKVLKKLAGKSLLLFKGERKKQIALLMDCKLLNCQVANQFAAGHIQEERRTIQKKIDLLGALPEQANEKLSFEYYWLKIYFLHAIEEFTECLELSYTALTALKKFKSRINELQKLRIELRIAESLYYLNRFAESFSRYEKVMRSRLLEQIPDRGYHIAKYIQVCLITDHADEAGRMIKLRISQGGKHLEKLLAPRDIFSFIKFYLFNKQFDEAFRFIQLGFEKNPKGKYFQYEVELRCLQTAYFYLTGQTATALEMCDKHVKFLRSHGYGVRNSAYPYFYILTKAIFDKKQSARKLSPKHEKMLARYRKGSYALYGKLLDKMLALK